LNLSDDFEQPREANGQFAPADTGVNGWSPPENVGEETFGLESVERSSGLTPNTPSAADISDDYLADEKIAVDALYPQDADQPVVDGVDELLNVPAVMLNRETGEPLDPTVTLKPEEAGNQYAAYEDDVRSYVEGLELQLDTDAVDAGRLQLLKSDPANAELYGLNKAEVEANAKQPEADDKAAAKPVEDDGLNEAERMHKWGQASAAAAQAEVERALENPIVVDALKERFAGVEQAREQYGQAINNATRVAEMAFLAQFPEFAGISDPNHAASVANSIKAQNPQRWMDIQHSVMRHNQLWQAQAAEQQHQAAQARQQFVQYREAEDAKFDKATGFSSMSNAQKAGITDEIKSMFSEAGYSPQEMGRLIQSDRTITSSLGQRVLFEAAQYRLMQKAAKAIPTRQAPRVQKPGNNEGRLSRAEQSLAALERNLANSGSEKDAWALLSAKIRSRG
jgi:hypothetical protein